LTTTTVVLIVLRKLILQHNDSSHIQQKHYQKRTLLGKDRTVISSHRQQAHSARIWKISHEKHPPLCRAKFQQANAAIYQHNA